MELAYTAIPANQLEVIKADGLTQALTPNISTRLSGWVIRNKTTGDLLTLKIKRQFKVGYMVLEAFTPWQLTTRKAARQAIKDGLLPGSFWVHL